MSIQMLKQALASSLLHPSKLMGGNRNEEQEEEQPDDKDIINLVRDCHLIQILTVIIIR